MNIIKVQFLLEPPTYTTYKYASVYTVIHYTIYTYASGIHASGTRTSLGGTVPGQLFLEACHISEPCNTTKMHSNYQYLIHGFFGNSAS